MDESQSTSLPIAAAAAASGMSEPTADSPTTSAADVTGYPKRVKNKQPSLTVPAGCTCFRLLCHASRISGVIGKSGAVIKQLQQETSAKIQVEVPIPSSDDRVITVIANSSVNRTLSFSKDNNNNKSDESSECSEVSAAQEALIRVFERILLVAAEADGGDLASGGVVSCRLLVDKSIIGSVIGKKGKVIEKIRKDTGCKIRVFTQDNKLSSSALTTDEMVEIEGDILAIKKALLSVTRCLQDRTYAHKGKTVLINGHTDIPSVSSDADTCPPRQQEIVFRMLCYSDRVGSVIGKSGTIIQAIEKESGASISFTGPVSGCDERVITITSMEPLESQNSSAQNAVILVFNRLETVRSSSTTGITASARLLILQNQKGCLLGKGGSIIEDMRKVTGAVIKIVGDHQVPKCALDTDFLVMMTGEFVNVRDALYSVTGRLRSNFLSSKMSKSHGTRGTYVNLPRGIDGLKLSSSIDHPPTPAKSHSRIAVRRSNFFSSKMSKSHGTRGTYVNLPRGIDGLKLSSSTDHPPTPAKSHSRIAVGRSAIVTGMSVEIVVPQNVIGRVYGENESNLTLLRQISGAKVVVHEPQSGSTDYIVVISGTPDETQSAQSLLQAFILSDQS